MALAIVWTEPAKADVRALDRTVAMRILHTLARYTKSGEGDIKQLTGVEPPELRLRAGDYRVRLIKSADTLTVLSVKHRSKAYL